MKHQITLSLVTSALLISSLQSFASTSKINAYQHEPTAEELRQIQPAPVVDYKLAPEEVTWQPPIDTADFKYVLLSSEAGFDEAANLRYTIAANLPEGVKLVLLVSNSNAERVKQTYAKYISPDRLILARDNSIEGGFWARDAFPYPVVNTAGQLSLVGAKYYRTFRSSSAIASSLSLNMSPNNFTFVGGNLIADENGVCFTIDSYRRFTTTENDLRNVYGCKDVHILKHYSGIGDVDEVVKPIGNKTILTNTPQYASDFKAWGYNVVLLPDVPNSYRTYANSLIVGKTAFMPTYGIASDETAKKVYEGLGYKVVGIRTNSLSDDQHGSIHCQTMAYPDVDEKQLMAALNLEVIH